MRSAAVDTLELALPTRAETELLRACLYEGAPARTAWCAWRAEIGDPARALSGAPELRRLVPLVHRALPEKGGTADERSLHRRLHVARVREEIRASALRGILHEVLGVLQRAGVTALVLKGTALAELAYPEPALRHCHDLDLLIPAAGVQTANRELLRHEGLLPDVAGRSDGTVTLRHRSGVAVNLHTELFPPPFCSASAPHALSRGQPAMVAGVPARVLSPPDMLVHICGRALSLARRPSLMWVADAWFALRRWPDLDWNALASFTSQGRLELPVSVALTYLAREVDIAVAPDILERLTEEGRRADGAQRDAALAAAWGARERRASLFTPAGRRQFRALGRWALVPSPAYLRAADGTRGTEWALPIRYAARSARWAARWMRARDPRSIARPASD